MIKTDVHNMMNGQQIPKMSEFIDEDQQTRPLTPEDKIMAEIQQQQQRRQVQVVPQSRDNPFAMRKYDNVQMPDTPLQFGGGMAESLLNDNEVPEVVREKHWWIFHKDNTLTFLDEERKKAKMLSFDIAKIDILNTTPYYDYTFEQELGFTVLRNVFETKLDRALGFKGTGQKNERIVLQSQFSENRMINEQGDGTQVREGFFRRLLGRR